jgi:ABC-2 type transport system ATP-binding protein
MKKNALELKSLTKTYTKKDGPPFNAVNNLSLTVPQGQLFGFLGPNGAGKTTTIKMICGLISSSGGSININGYDLNKDRFNAMRNIGAVLEGARNIYWQMSAWNNLMYFAGLKGSKGAAVEKRAEQLLKALKLWERKDDVVGSFSRGMQQKVAIGCALIADPPILLLDEPTLGLDIHACQTVKELIKKLAYEDKKTVIITTHQLDVAQELCDRIAIIRGGRIIMDKPTDELLHLFKDEFYSITIDAPINLTDTKYDHLIHNKEINIESHEDKTIITFGLDKTQLLHSLLQMIADQQLPLQSVTKSKHTLEQVFVKLLEEQS